MTKQRPCDVEAPEDFHRYYTHGYIEVFFKPNIPSVVHVYGFRSPYVQIAQVHLDEKGMPTEDTIQNIGWKDFKAIASFGRPLLGNINYGPTLVYQSVRGERAFNRGLHTSVVRGQQFNDWELRDFPAFRYSPQTISAVLATFNPGYISAPEAYKNLVEGTRVGAAITRHVGAYTIPDSDHPQLTYKRWTVGELIGEGIATIQQEYKDYSKYMGSQANLRFV